MSKDDLVHRLRDWSDGPHTWKLTDEAADEIERLRTEIDEWKSGLRLTVDRALQAEAERDALRAALEFQRDALYIVRDRQGGRASVEDLTKGIALIDAALARGK